VGKNQDRSICFGEAGRKGAEAVATEQENRAKVSENRAKLVEAEASVPRAMADAFRKGNLTTAT